MSSASPAQVQSGAGEVPLVAHLRHAAEDEATRAHRLLDLRVPTKDVPYARGPNSAAGRRGRRRSAYEAPRAAADRGTRLGGAESKRRRRPRLPAPPSRVTLLVAPVGPAAAVLGQGGQAVGAEWLPRGPRRDRVQGEELAAHDLLGLEAERAVVARAVDHAVHDDALVRVAERE